MEDNTTKKKQIEIAERLQLLILQRWETLLTNPLAEVSPTEISTMAKTLRDNGWSIDPAMIPQGLRSKLLTDPTKVADEDPDVLPFRTGT